MRVNKPIFSIGRYSCQPIAKWIGYAKFQRDNYFAIGVSISPKALFFYGRKPFIALPHCIIFNRDFYGARQRNQSPFLIYCHWGISMAERHGESVFKMRNSIITSGIKKPHFIIYGCRIKPIAIFAYFIKAHRNGFHSPVVYTAGAPKSFYACHSVFSERIRFVIFSTYNFIPKCINETEFIKILYFGKAVKKRANVFIVLRGYPET